MIEVESGENIVITKKGENFTPMQEQFWDTAYQENSAEDPVLLTMIDDKRYDPFRDNMWIGQLIFDDEGTFCDLEMLFHGQKLAEYYGQRRGQNMLTNYSNNSFRTDFPTYHYRFRNLLDFFLEKRLPVLSTSQYKENKAKRITVDGLMFPASRTGKTVDAVFGITEITID